MTACTPALQQHALTPGAAAHAARILKAMADPLRLRMLSAMATDERGEVCVCDLTPLGEVAQPTVSHHLKILRSAGLVTAERRGTWVYYRVHPTHHDTILALISGLTSKDHLS